MIALLLRNLRYRWVEWWNWRQAEYVSLRRLRREYWSE